MNEIKVINTEKAPAAIGPYVQAKEMNGFVFTSGQLPINPETGEMPTEISAQTVQSLENVKAIIEAAGSDMDSIMKMTVYLNDIKDFTEMNTVYETYFNGSKPARSAFEVARLPKDALIEIEAIAVTLK